MLQFPCQLHESNWKALLLSLSMKRYKLTLTMTTYNQLLAAIEQIATRLDNKEISAQEAGKMIRSLPYVSIFKRFDPDKRYNIYDVLHEAIEDIYDKRSNAMWYEIVHNALCQARERKKTTRLPMQFLFEDELYNGVYNIVKTLGGVHYFYRYVRVIERKIKSAYYQCGSEILYINEREDIM